MKHKELLYKIACQFEGICYDELHQSERKVCTMLVEAGFAKWVNIFKNNPELKRLKAIRR